MALIISLIVVLVLFIGIITGFVIGAYFEHEKTERKIISVKECTLYATSEPQLRGILDFGYGEDGMMAGSKIKVLVVGHELPEWFVKQQKEHKNGK